MDVSRVRSVGELLNQETSRQLLTAGQQWQGTAWNTSKASKVLYSLTGVPIVRGVWQEYRNAFLYALSLYLEVEILELDLSDRVADVAFSLAQVFSSPVKIGTQEALVRLQQVLLFCLLTLQNPPKKTKFRYRGTNHSKTFPWSWPTSGPTQLMGKEGWT